jgi:uncharacterized protein (DUF433 family)
MADQWLVSDPDVINGKHGVCGTRITIDLILEELAAAATVEQTPAAHLCLTRGPVYAAIACEGKALRANAVYWFALRHALQYTAAKGGR